MSKRTPSAEAPTVSVGSIRDLQPDTLNANKGTRRGRAMLEHSVRQYGAGRSVLADKQGRLIAGNKTVEAALSAGVEEVIVVPTDGRQLVVVQRTDLDLEQDVAAKELAIADNQANLVGVQWDPEHLKQLGQQGVDLQQFFRGEELARVMKDQAEKAEKDLNPDMEIRPFEHHDYIMIVFTSVHEWTRALDLLQIKRAGVTLGGTRKVGLGRVISGDRFFKVLDATIAAEQKKAAS